MRRIRSQASTRGSAPLAALPLLFLLPLFILFAVPAAAIQVSPAGLSFTLAPGAVDSYELRVVNDEADPIAVTLIVDAPFADSVTLSPRSFVIAPSSEGIALVTLLHPSESLLEPGRNRAAIIVKKRPAEGGQFGGAVTLIHNLDLYRPYAGAFLEAVLSVRDAPAPDQAGIVSLAIVNRGDDGTEASADALLRSPSGEEAASFSLGPRRFVGGEEGKIDARFRHPERGRYDLNVTLQYHDGDVPVLSSFTGEYRVGSPLVVLGEPMVALAPGEVGDVRVPLSLDWNEEVAAELLLELRAGERVVASFRGERLPLPPRDGVELRGFLDVPPAPDAAYALHVTVDGLAAGVLGRLELPVVFSSEPDAPPSVPVRSSAPLLLVAVAILLLLVAVFLWRRRRR